MIRDKKEAAKGLLFAVAITVFVLIIAALPSHCATTSKNHNNSLGAVQYQHNPNTYLAGAIISVAYAGAHANYGISVSVQPIGTYGLYTENLLLCYKDDLVERFVNKTNPMVLTYETKSHHTVEGIGCHELKSVLSIKEENLSEIH